MEFLSPLSSQFLGHWKQLRGSNPLPHSSAFLDRALPELAPITSILEVFEGDMRVRLQGTAIVERWGDDKTGFSFFELNPLMPRNAILGNIRLAMGRPCGLGSRSRLGNLSNRVTIVEIVSLPLAVDAGRPPRLVNISSIVEALGYDERATGLTTMAFEWIDVGHGIPGESPAQVTAAVG